LSKEEKETIENSTDLISLIESIFQIEEKKNILLRKEIYKEYIEQKLTEEELTEEELTETLPIHTDLKEKIEKSTDYYSLMDSGQKIIQNIMITQAIKSEPSLKEVKQKAKSTLKKIIESGKEKKDFSDYEIEIDQSEDKFDIIEIEAKLLFLDEEIKNVSKKYD
jgi:hypothetical protein